MSNLKPSEKHNPPSESTLNSTREIQSQTNKNLNSDEHSLRNKSMKKKGIFKKYFKMIFN